ncbi:MAG: tetratricopeptide repeat protein [Metamycoplasmataceae bacterium]
MEIKNEKAANKKLNNLDEVKEWVFHQMKSLNKDGNESKFIYRGQGNSEWLLNSNYLRNEYSNELEDKNKKLTIEDFNFLINYFQQKNNYLKTELKDSDDLSLLGKMQHYGKLTPLIDFTEDILVALWFAASFPSKEENKYFKIFFYELKMPSEIKNEINFEIIEFEKIHLFKFKTYQKFGRSISQKGVFVFDTLNLDKHFQSVLIETKLQKEILKWLTSLGINANSLFPDEEGIFDNFDSLSPEKIFMDGIKLFQKLKFEEASKKFEEVIELRNNDYISYYSWGTSLNKLGKHEEAIEKYIKATKLDPKPFVAYDSWGNALYGLGKFEEAIEKYIKAIEINTNYYDSYNNWGAALNVLGKYEEAIEKYIKAIELNPNHSNAYNNWGNALYGLGKFEEAIEKYIKAIEINPNHSNAYNGWAAALQKLGKSEEAKKILDKINKK